MKRLKMHGMPECFSLKLRIIAAGAEIIQDNIDKDSSDSYYSGTIVLKFRKSKKVYTVIVSGSVRGVSANGEVFKDRPPEDEGFSPKDVEWLENNWFEIVETKDYFHYLTELPEIIESLK